MKKKTTNAKPLRKQPNALLCQASWKASKAAGFAQFSVSPAQEPEVIGVTRTIPYSEAQRCTVFPSNNIS